MSTPTVEQVTAALATVNDPEIKRPITELNMVDSVTVDDLLDHMLPENWRDRAPRAGVPRG